MRLRRLLLGMALVVLVATMAALAQPPGPPAAPFTQPPTLPAQPQQPTQPLPPVVTPKQAQPPAVTVPPAIPGVATTPPLAANASPLGRFEPLVSFSPQIQASVRSVLLAGNWMTRMNQSHGRFIFGFNPALRQPLPRDHDLLQARAALAMAQLAAFTGDEKHAAIASQAILTLLTTTRPDPADPNCRVPLQSSLVCNRVGFAATLALAIDALPSADVKLQVEAEKLCEFLHKNCLPDGSIQYADAPNSLEIDPVGVNEHPGVALQAIVVGNRLHPAAWKTDVLKRSLAYYPTLFQARPHPLLAATLAPAFAELFLQTRMTEAATFVCELNDLLCRFQIPAGDARMPQWIGGFRAAAGTQMAESPSGAETGFYLQSLCYAMMCCIGTQDLERGRKYAAAAQDAIPYLTDLQYVETNTRHFETSFRVNMLIGAYHLSPTDGNVRIDATATAVSGLLQFLLTWNGKN